MYCYIVELVPDAIAQAACEVSSTTVLSPVSPVPCRQIVGCIPSHSLHMTRAKTTSAVVGSQRCTRPYLELKEKPTAGWRQRWYVVAMDIALWPTDFLTCKASSNFCILCGSPVP